LLERAGFIVRCEPSGCEELILHDSPRELALANAEIKGRTVSARFPGEVILAADTIVILDGRIFGKPLDLADAEKMLAALSDRTHEVVTGVYIRRDDRAVRFSETTRVRFRPFARPEIADYFRDIDPLDKAGAYAAQEDRGRLIECIEGSFSNVVGLPLERVAASLAQHFNITPPGAGYPVPVRH